MRSLALALVLLATPASAAPCRPLVDFVVEAAAVGLTVVPVPARGVPQLVETYNSSPPASDEKFDAAAYVEINEGALVLLMRGADVCGHLKAPPGSWQRLKAQLLGEVS